MLAKSACFLLSFAICLVGLGACSSSSQTTMPSMDSKTVTFVDEQGIGYDLYPGGWMITDYRGEEENIRIPASKTIDGETHDVIGIADSAFYGRKNLAAIELPDTITSIGRAAFCGASLKTLIITPNITFIGEDAFVETPFAGKAENGILFLPSNSNSKCAAYLANSEQKKNKDVVFPSNLEIVYDGVYAGCSFREAPSLESLVYIGDNAFSEATFGGELKLTNIRNIGVSAFQGCSGIKTLNVSGPLESIGEYAFAKVASLESVTLPGSVVSQGKHMFENCSSLKDVTMPFLGTTKKEAPLKLTDFMPRNVFESLTILDGYLAEGFLGFCTVKKLTLHTSDIPEKAFVEDHVDSLYLLDGVKHVGSRACSKMPLSYVYISKSVYSVGGYAFYTSSNLTIDCEIDGYDMLKWTFDQYSFLAYNPPGVKSYELGDNTTVNLGVSVPQG